MASPGNRWLGPARLVTIGVGGFVGGTALALLEGAWLGWEFVFGLPLGLLGFNVLRSTTGLGKSRAAGPDPSSWTRELVGFVAMELAGLIALGLHAAWHLP